MTCYSLIKWLRTDVTNGLSFCIGTVSICHLSGSIMLKENRKQGRCLLKIANVLFQADHSRMAREPIKVGGLHAEEKLIRASEHHAEKPKCEMSVKSHE